ncbi:MAG: UDP-4-amino-4,6-dideoxy-N-acetyl-beta-L-altrosamine transaminase [Bacteroidota bacterium]
MVNTPTRKVIPYGRQSISPNDIEAVVQVLQGDWLTQGPLIAQFEAAFADYVDAKYAVAVSNGTTALHLSALALGVNEQSKVLTTPITFAASANCIRYCGGEVAFADIDPATALIDLAAVRRELEAAPAGTFDGMVLVDFAGQAVDLEAFRELADEFGLWIIQDSCHSPGGFFTDRKGNTQRCGNGNFADLAIFSFHPVKHIACGEGGMVTTNDPEIYEKLCMLRTHGITKDPQKMHEQHGGWYYEMQELGYNYRLTDMQCALGLSQLSRAEQGIARRQELAAQYDAFLAPMGIKRFHQPRDPGHAFHLYVVELEERDQVYQQLREAGIYAQVHYIPLHQMPYYQKRQKPRHLPHAEAYYRRCLSLPMYPGLTDEEQDFVIRTLLSCIQ